MKNQAFIKLVDEPNEAYIDIDTYGITLTRGWREALLAPPPVKTYVSNDSRLENGVAIVASAKYVRQDKRDINLSFFLEGETEEDYLYKYERFLDKIAYNGEFCLKAPCLKRVYKLVYTQCTKYGDYGLKKSNFTLKLTESNPYDREKL